MSAGKEVPEAGMPSSHRNTFHTVPSLDILDNEPLDVQFLESLLDPLAPLDFGSIDLHTITGIKNDNCPLDNPSTVPELPSAFDDFGGVPFQPHRDGMVPEYRAGSSLPPITTGSLVEFAPTSSAPHAAPLLSPRAAAVNESFSFNPLPPITTGIGINGEVGKPGESPSKSPPPPPPSSSHRSKKSHGISSVAAPKFKKKTSPTYSFADKIDNERSREDILTRWREKKARRGFQRHQGFKYESRKRTALVKPRINGKFVTPEIYQQHLTDPAKLHTVSTS